MSTAYNISNSSFWLAPLVWALNSTAAIAVTSGARAKVQFTGTSFSLAVYCGDAESNYAPTGGITYAFPNCVRYNVDDTGWVNNLLTTNSNQSVSASGYAAGTHTLEIVFNLISNTDRNTPTSFVGIYGITLDTSAVLSFPSGSFAPKANGFALIYGDSITDNVFGGVSGAEWTGNGTATKNADSMLVWSTGLCAYLQVDESRIANPGQGYVCAGSHVPGLQTSSGTIYSGESRLTGGIYTSQPAYVVIAMGRNDVAANGVTLTAANVTATLVTQRGQAPSAKIIVITPFDGTNLSTIQSGYHSWGDSNSILISSPPWLATGSGGTNTGEYVGDGIHLREQTQLKASAAVTALFALATASTTGGGSGVASMKMGL